MGVKKLEAYGAEVLRVCGGVWQARISRCCDSQALSAQFSTASPG